MTVTDMQVIDLLGSAGPMTAGQLADLTGLTTGAITGMLNRLQEAGRLRRERDPADGRRVIVLFASGKDGGRALDPGLASLGAAWDDLAARYDDEQIVFLVAFLKQCNALFRKGWVAALIFDDQTFSAVGNDVRMQSPGYDATAPCYDIEATGAASAVTITSG